MATKFFTSQTFSDGDTVNAQTLNDISTNLNVYQALITDQAPLTSVGTLDKILIADSNNTAGDQPKSITVYNLLNGAMSNGTYTDAQFSGTITSGTTNSSRATIGTASITFGTIPNLTSGTTNSTKSIIQDLTAGTTISTKANITTGTVQTLTASTLVGNLTGGSFSGLINSSTGTFSGSINSSTGTIGTSTSSYSTSGTISASKGTIANLDTTLIGDLTISTGSATVGTRIAVVNTAQEYTATHNFNATTLTSGASIAWALPSNQVSRLVLSTNGTMADPTGKVDGATYMLIATQGTGSNTLSWNATYKFPGGTTPTLSTGSGVSDIFTFVSNGTSMFGVASQNYAA